MTTGGTAWQTSAELGNTAPRAHTDVDRLTRLPKESPLQALAGAVERHEWMRDAACVTTDPEAWFPRKGTHDSTTGRAMYLCRHVCPVRQACLAYALQQPAPPLGIWGGTTEQQRRVLRQKEVRA